ncbi:CHAT domain-containing protein [Lactifluus volemus]|nr:CHAT domain-containing protein [Lactifluus volemus]
MAIVAPVFLETVEVFAAFVHQDSRIIFASRVRRTLGVLMPVFSITSSWLAHTQYRGTVQSRPFIISKVSLILRRLGLSASSATCGTQAIDSSMYSSFPCTPWTQVFEGVGPTARRISKNLGRRAIELGNRLVDARKHNHLESKQNDRTLRSVLKGLYELVRKPVIEVLRVMKIPEQSRVGGVPHPYLLSSSPCDGANPFGRRHHALLLGHIHSPTLSALIASRKPQAEGKTFQKPSTLLVAQPESLKNAIREIWIIQRLTTTVTSLISKNATPSRVVEGLNHHQFSHFVCHGNLEEGKPFNASFELSGGRQLTLLEIVRSQLPTAEFAFLSVCHTAELTEESISDEALHLTAAMQYCSFRSVVGTMWAMADQDGQYLAEDFYKSILSSDEPGVPYYERSARALRDAVKNLRSKKVPLGRWVNYYGV